MMMMIYIYIYNCFCVCVCVCEWVHILNICVYVSVWKKIFRWCNCIYIYIYIDEGPLCSVDGHVLFTDKASLFGADRVDQDPAVLRILQEPFKRELDELPAVKEITKATEQFRSRWDSSRALERWRTSITQLAQRTPCLLLGAAQTSKWSLRCNHRHRVQKQGRKVRLLQLPGVTLLFIAGKVLARVLLSRLVPTIAEDHQPENQCGFRPNRGITDIVFILRQLQEKCWVQDKGLYNVCGPDQSVWNSEQKGTVDDHGAPWLPPPKFLGMVIQLHKDQYGQVRLNSNLSRRFPIVNWAKQGCVLALTVQHLFQHDAFADHSRPWQWRCCIHSLTSWRQSV